ncbi:uncharacterized protein LOC102808186 [Saccoglossus kowalevskii]|uniref:Uncharacterized protein LOC102808186 n=1 Tax=Saccoglossus kowalevskii TaxID=10224 RepID=A0ABM0MIZ0_SACKO|nr:PREDICTED: uncharacterized protein LOC102808186 [Saccoglossus kowalevskii]
MNSIYKSRGIVGGRFGVAEVSRNVRATERAALRKSRRGQETDKRRNIGSPLTVSSSPERKLTLVEKLALYKKEKAKKAGNAKHKKKIFKVAHIVYDDKQWFSSGQPGKIKPKAQVRNHERTRFSARLASKQKELQKKNAVAKKSTIPDCKSVFVYCHHFHSTQFSVLICLRIHSKLFFSKRNYLYNNVIDKCWNILMVF